MKDMNIDKHTMKKKNFDELNLINKNSNHKNHHSWRNFELRNKTRNLVRVPIDNIFHPIGPNFTELY
jgi:hypothetical protein